MIPFFDKFIDTREKRYHLLLLFTLLSFLVLLLPYLYLAIKLISLTDYSSLYEFLDKPYIEWTFMSRVIADFISISSLTFPNILECILANLGILEIIGMVLLFFSFRILEKKRVTTICLFLLVVEVMFSCVFAFLSLNAGSLMPVIINIQRIGMVMLVINIILTCIIMYHLYRQIHYYQVVYAYDVEEIKEL